MLEKLTNLPPKVDGVKATGKVSREDYARVFEPMLEEALREGRHLRFLYQFAPEFEGLTPGAAWEDAKLGLRSMRLFDGCAIVTDVGWLRELTRLVGFMMPCPVQVFGNQQLDNAITWLASLPEGARVSHRLIPESGVIVVDVEQALRAQDFDAVAATADQWIEAHGELQGVVIHVRQFPGWENFASLVRHVRFIRDHHRQVKRVALAADSKLSDVVPELAKHFVAAEVKSFGYDAVDDAIAWAAGPGRTQAAPVRPSSPREDGAERRA